MDPLATLGDAILTAVVVYKSYDDGNKQDKVSLTTEKILKGNRKNTRIVAEKHQLQKYVHWGKGEKQDECWNKGETALDAVFEALIGGVFLDSQRKGKNGMTEVEKNARSIGIFFKSTAK